MRRDPRSLLVAALVLALGACGGGSSSTSFTLDGSRRVPDDEGMVTAVDIDTITLDGERRYAIDDDLVSFSSIDLSAVPLLYTESQYVQVGLHDDEVRWIGAVARPLTTNPPRVLYEGKVERVDGSRLEFANGTVFAVARGVPVAARAGQRVTVGLRPDRHAVMEVMAR